MQLVICGQDIRSLTLGVWDGSEMIHEKTVEANPESYLSALDEALQEWNVENISIERVVVITGPGSFTASRVSTTIANALAFTKQIPVVGLENAERLPMSQLLAQTQPEAQAYAVPSYNRPPNITASFKSSGDK